MSHSRSRALGAALAVATAVIVIATRVQSSPPSSSKNEPIVAREIAALELVIGSPLTPDERREVADAIAGAMRANPEALLHDQRTWIAPLEHAGKDRGFAAALRRSARMNVELAKPIPRGLEQAYTFERRLVQARDATVVFDATRSHLVTERTVRDLHTTAAWFGTSFGLPAPGAKFANHVRDWLRDNYALLDDHVASALETSAETLVFAQQALVKIDPRRRAEVTAKVREQFKAADEPTRDVALAVVGATLALAAVEHRTAKTSPERYMDLVRIVLLGTATVRGINQNGPHR